MICGTVLVAARTESADGTPDAQQQHHCNLSPTADSQSSFANLYGGHDNLTASGTFQFAPITWPYTTGGCRYARVEVYISGVSDDEKECDTGFWYHGSCAAHEGDLGPEIRVATAVQVAWASTPKYYGVRSSYVNRFIVDIGGGHDLRRLSPHGERRKLELKPPCGA